MRNFCRTCGALAIRGLRRTDEHRVTTAGAISADQQERLQQVLRFIQENCTRKIRLRDVAAIAGKSTFHFHRVFRAHFGKTIKQATIECQVELAKQLLLTGLSAADVATRVGFCNESHLSQRFKDVTGLPPVSWLRVQRSTFARQCA